MIKNRRNFFRRGLHELYLPIYDALCEILDPSWQPTDGLRTFEIQEQLYALGRTEPGVKVTNAVPGLSYHNYGLASDWGYFSDPSKGKWLPLAPDDPRWQEYMDACEKAGARTLSWEKPHNEYPLPYPVRNLLDAHTRGGMAAVDLLLRSDPPSP